MAPSPSLPPPGRWPRAMPLSSGKNTPRRGRQVFAAMLCLSACKAPSRRHHVRHRAPRLCFLCVMCCVVLCVLSFLCFKCLQKRSPRKRLGVGFRDGLKNRPLQAEGSGSYTQPRRATARERERERARERTQGALERGPKRPQETLETRWSCGARASPSGPRARSPANRSSHRTRSCWPSVCRRERSGC